MSNLAKLSSVYLEKFTHDESGATAIEYGLIAGLIAVVIITALSNVGSAQTENYDSINAAVSAAVNR